MLLGYVNKQYSCNSIIALIHMTNILETLCGSVWDWERAQLRGYREMFHNIYHTVKNDDGKPMIMSF
jgi:hypothetical protein